ncbi:MAG: hypothetical protein K2J04_07190, partial [Lachnospiraceae bacterium]|nr:hypothetical protein [Lachnospiraceae bacterium]
ANEYTLGDVNCDGYLDSRDASIILKEYSLLSTGALSSLNENQKLSADVNGDDCINAYDASILLNTYASYGSGVNSEYQELFDISPNMNAPYDGGFTSEEIENSPIKPVLSVSKEVLTMEEVEGNPIVTVSVNLSELGGNQMLLCSGGITIEYDNRLKPVLNKFGSVDVSVGEAIKYLTNVCKLNEETGCIFIALAGSADRAFVGNVVKIQFELPDDVQYGDLYRIGIAYTGCEIFTNSDDDETGKLMQAYLFNDVIENNKHANDDNYEYWGKSVGYIKIEDELIMTTPTTTIITSAKTTSTTTTTTPTTDSSVKVTLLGDVNCDGQVTIADSTAILQALGNPDKYGLSVQGAVNADCCDPGDGVLPSDALAIQKIDAKVIAKLPEITAKK